MSWLRDDTYLYLRAQRFRVDMLNQMEQSYQALGLIRSGAPKLPIAQMVPYILGVLSNEYHDDIKDIYTEWQLMPYRIKDRVFGLSGQVIHSYVFIVNLYNNNIVALNYKSQPLDVPYMLWNKIVRQGRRGEKIDRTRLYKRCITCDNQCILETATDFICIVCSNHRH